MTLFPLVAATLALAAGALGGLRWDADPLLAGALAAAVAALVLLRGAQAGRWVTLLAFVVAGVSLGAAARERVTADCRERLADGAAMEARGVLAANLAPSIRDAPPRAAPLRLQGVAVRGVPVGACGGEIRARFADGVPALRAGTEVRLGGVWERGSGPVVASAWPADPGFAGTLRVETVSTLAPPRFTAHPLLTVRGATSARIARLFPRHAALVDALLLGRREALDPALRDRFTRAGLIHLLAISGAHVAVLAGAVLLLGRAFGSRFGLGRGGLAAACIVLLAAYLAMIGAPASALRAGVMIALGLIGFALQRPSSPFPIIAAAALLLIAWDPLVLLNPGAQLSFAGVLGIVAVHRWGLSKLPDAWRSGGWRRWLAESLAVSVAAFLATLPFTWFHFGQIAPVAILANVPAVPLTGLALIAVVAALVVAPILPAVGALFAATGGLLLDGIAWIAAVAADSPLASVGIARPALLAVAAVTGAALLAWAAGRRLRSPVRWAVGAGAATAMLLALPSFAAPAPDALEIHFVDVGQGDAIALRTPDARWVLIDAGPRGERWDAGERRVLPFLRAHGATRLEALILTHPDADHIGGASAVLRGIPVGRLVEPGLAVGKPLYLETLRTAEERDVAWGAAREGRTLRIDGVELSVLAPTPETLDAAEEANEISVVLWVRYGKFDVLLTGDLSDEGERRLVAQHGPELRVEILKAGHHGSESSTSAALLDAARPELVVVSAGRRNRYGHPAPEVLARLRAREIPVSRTDREGTVSVRARPDGRWERIRP